MKTAVRRWAPYVALSLALALAAGYGWYRMSDTGKGWRYEESLKTFCEGLIPDEESAELTEKDGSQLIRDSLGGALNDYNSCTVGGIELSIGRIPEAARDTDSPDIFSRLDEDSGETPPIPLGGGWRGYTDLVNTAVVLPCANKSEAVVVTGRARHVNVYDDSDDGYNAMGLDYAHDVAEFVAATAVNAAKDSDCDAKAGGRIPRLAAVPEWKSPVDAAGTCAGIPYADQDWVEWVKDVPASGTAPLERCVLGTFVNYGSTLLELEAAFGPFAQRLLPDDPDAGNFKGGAGGAEGFYWATARCPGSGLRAVFWADPASDVTIDKESDVVARKALVAFAENRAKQHGCTDLKVPSASS